jgi:uncharacterized protein with von Willebrand factor type A (vWA) domain
MTFGQTVSSLFGRKQRAKLSASALGEDRLRDALVHEAEPEVPRFGHMIANPPQTSGNEIWSGENKWATFPELMRDVARAATQYDEPKVNTRDRMLPSHALNREILFQVLGTEDFRDVRRHAAGNPHDGLFSAVAMQDAIENHAAELGEHVERSDAAKDAEEALDGIEESIDQLREDAKKFKDQQQPIPPEHVALTKAAVAKREELKAELAQIDQANAGSNVAKVAHAIAAEATQAAGEMMRVSGMLQGIAPGAEGSLDPSHRIQMAEEWASNARLKRILDEAGKLVRDMRFKRQERSKNVPIEPVGVTSGRNINRLLTVERAYAAAPPLRAIFAKRYSTHSLLEYKMDGKDRVGKGAIVMVVDESSSMKNAQRIEHAKAVQIATLAIAVREKRPFAGVSFGGAGQCRAWEFPVSKRLDSDAMLEMAGHFYRGGTDISAGLKCAANIVFGFASKPFATADVVLLTDGQCAFGEQDKAICEELRAANVAIHGISIAAPNNRYLEQACDWHVELADLSGWNEATDRLATQLT